VEFVIVDVIGVNRMWVIYAILGGFARRWFGGVFDGRKILGNRGLQTAYMILLFLSIYLPASQNWLLSIIITAWLQFQFWSRGHGCAFDIGRGGYPTPETIKRYEERWYHKPCDWLASKGCFTYYSTTYDFCYMTLRYTCPMIPMMIFDWRYFLIGLSVSVIYLICWSFNLKGKKDWCNCQTEIAEILCGAVVFAGCYLLGV
jgi:hypothetical protein